jgi:hypothetical protein
MKLLQDAEWSHWSDRDISRQCNVTHPFVAKLREQMAPPVVTGNVTSEGTFTTKPGTVAKMNTAAIGAYLYFGGCSSLFSQRITLSVFRGSGRSQSKHWKVRCPLPSGGSAKTRYAPQLGQVGRSAWPMARILPPVATSVK